MGHDGSILADIRAGNIKKRNLFKIIQKSLNIFPVDVCDK